MNCKARHYHQPILNPNTSPQNSLDRSTKSALAHCELSSPSTCQKLITYSNQSTLLTQINSGQLLVVDSRRRNGLIIFKRFHAEFAGPGAAVGGFFDIDAQQIVAVGDVALIYPQSHEERQKAFWTRRHWIRLTEQITEHSVPMERARMILSHFENYFDRETVAKIPDEALARLVGVLPSTINMVRRTACNFLASAPLMPEKFPPTNSQ